ncbi:peptidase S8 [Mesorhizobium tamadayense]|uniref:Peptidase S8 n=1 Tax=Mesorhizobium tamadayense TaxID=425306 RepID=A0A3P3G0L8_9HYPH|nr:S8 family serine peptidase [Mesorhizobium tamadayense]RRI04385.1 peptidase S8 [Mesorhizobium tamadayense]
MAAKVVILHAAILAAAFVAAPAFAQTNDPTLTQKQIDCLGRTTVAGTDCDKKGGGTENGGNKPGTGAAAGGAVFLPTVIVDLFPNPPASGALPSPSNGASQPGGALNTPPPSPPPTGPVAPPTGLNLAAPPRAVAGEFVPDEVLVTVAGDAGAVQQIATAFGLQVRSQRQSRLLGGTLVRFGIPDGRPVGVVLAQLAADGRTQRREPNHIYSLQQAAGIVNYAFERIALDASQASGENVRVAVIDTGIDDTNPALKGVIADQFDAMPNVPIEKRDHGTSVDGLIAGVGPLEGMAPGAMIYHARAFEGGKSTMDVILSALDWAAEQDVRIINMSFVGPKNDLLGTACRNARALGMVLVAAAGNNGPKAPYGYPAAFDGVIAVTATDAKDGLMAQANRGPYVFISAPGVEMVAPSGAGSDVVTGTSFAAAIVSGAIANLIHAAPERSADDIEKALAATAKDLGPKGRDNDFGYGLLDTKAAGAAKE